MLKNINPMSGINFVKLFIEKHMKKILLRAGKNPFSAMNAYETFDKNVIGNNNGNLLFQSAAHKLLSTSGCEVISGGLNFNASMAGKVNDEYDYFVLPLANAFRLSFEPQLKKLTDFVKALKIPVVMLSGGCQSGSDGGFSNLNSMKNTVIDFCQAILEKSTHITVRGEKTADYIESLGFKNIIVIGCPSMTMNGPSHTVYVPKSWNLKQIAYNVETSKDICGNIFSDIESRFDAVYFPQDIKTMEMMLWGGEKFSSDRSPFLPLRSSHKQFSSNSIEFHLDPSTWINRMRDFDLSLGPRIHGNVIPILAGTPSVVMAHDSRTTELAEYHQIPHFKDHEISSVECLEQVLDRVNYDHFNKGLSDRFYKVADFLKINGLNHIYEESEKSALDEYNRRLKSVRFSEPLKFQGFGMSENERARLGKIRDIELMLKILKKSIIS